MNTYCFTDIHGHKELFDKILFIVLHGICIIFFINTNTYDWIFRCYLCYSIFIISVRFNWSLIVSHFNLAIHRQMNVNRNTGLRERICNPNITIFLPRDRKRG